MVKERQEAEFDVEALLDMRKINGQAYYLVKWLGYSEAEATWEPLSNLSGSLPLVRLFHENTDKKAQIAQKHHKIEAKPGKEGKKTVLEEWFIVTDRPIKTPPQALQEHRVARVVKHYRNAKGELQFEVQRDGNGGNSILSLQEMEECDPKRLIEYFASIV